MLSVRRLFYVILMVLGICGMFLLSNINEKDTAIWSVKQEVRRDVEKKQKILKGENRDNLEKTEEVQFYILGDEKKEFYGDIYRNVCGLMEDLKVSWKKRSCIGDEELRDHKAVFIFCDDTLHSYVDLRRLANFIEAGGKVILAAGLAEGYEDSYLQPVLGIVEKTIKESYPKLRFQKGFFPVQEEEMTYDGYHASTWIAIRKEANVYVEDAEGKVPIVYSYAYGNGVTLLINSTILQDQRMMGFLAAGIGCLVKTFVYPVVGVESIALEHFPEVTSIDDKFCMKLYGRNTEAFVRDVVNPVLQGMAVRQQLPYSIICEEELSDRAKEKANCVKGKSDSKTKSIDFQNRISENLLDTRGVDLERGNLLSIASSLAGFGIVSHTFDVNQFLTMDGKEASWERAKYQLKDFEKRVLEHTEFLIKTTAADAKGACKSYMDMDCSWKESKDCIVIYADNMVEGQPFFVRSKKRIRKAQGAEVVALENNYFFVRLNSCKAVLTLE